MERMNNLKDNTQLKLIPFLTENPGKEDSYTLCIDANTNDLYKAEDKEVNTSSFLLIFFLVLVFTRVGTVAAGAAVTVIAAGTLASVLFETVYDSNLGGLQDGLDWVGGKIDQAGEVISDGLSAINPMNWAW